MFFGNPSVVDVDGDGLPEIVQGSGGGFVHAMNHLGAEPAGWPKFTNGWMIPIPVAGDIDGDGLLEVVAASREGFLTVWDVPGAAGTNATQWDGFRHDRQRTGALRSGVPAGLVPAGCRAGVYPLKLRATRLRRRTAPASDSLRMRGSFRLAGNALDFASDDFELRLTGTGTAYSGVVAGGLAATHGRFTFSGPAAGGGAIDVKITAKRGLLYHVTASASGFSAAGSAVPNGTAIVRVGDDCFAATVACTGAADGQTEVCKGRR